jgi:hypothetical protein
MSRGAKVDMMLSEEKKNGVQSEDGMATLGSGTWDANQVEAAIGPVQDAHVGARLR